MTAIKEDDVILVRLITDEGELLNIQGYAREGVGILDVHFNLYPAGLTEDGTIYCCSADSSNILTVSECRHEYVPGWSLNASYKLAVSKERGSAGI